MENYLYSADHKWPRRDGEEALIGITGFADGELGDMVYVDIETGRPDAGSERGTRIERFSLS